MFYDEEYFYVRDVSTLFILIKDRKGVLLDTYAHRDGKKFWVVAKFAYPVGFDLEKEKAKFTKIVSNNKLIDGVTFEESTGDDGRPVLKVVSTELDNSKFYVLKDELDDIIANNQ